jgi:hypothetical protein
MKKPTGKQHPPPSNGPAGWHFSTGHKKSQRNDAAKNTIQNTASGSYQTSFD